MKISKRRIINMLCGLVVYPLAAQTTGTLSFTCTTNAPSGDWGDKHVAAVWIQNNENPSVFIKTNAKYGHEDDHLTSWYAISNSNLVDAVTGATLTSYGTITIEWDGTDVSHNVVMDGNYSVYIEMGWGKDKVNDHKTTKFSFTKGTSEQSLTPEGNTNFSDVSITWQPTVTLLSASEDAEGILVFPNPSNGEIRLNFQEELHQVKLNVSDLSGKTIYTEESPLIIPGIKSLDLADVPQGIYLLTINSGETYFRFKLVIDN